MTMLTAGLKCAPLIGPNIVIRTVSLNDTASMSAMMTTASPDLALVEKIHRAYDGNQEKKGAYVLC